MSVYGAIFQQYAIMSEYLYNILAVRDDVCIYGAIFQQYAIMSEYLYSILAVRDDVCIWCDISAVCDYVW